MDNNLKFFHYCYEGDYDNALKTYYDKYPVNSISIRWKNDKVFKFCCESAQDMDGYSDRFTEHAKKLIKIIKFLCDLCPLYHIKVIDNKLIEWKIQKQIIITI